MIPSGLDRPGQNHKINRAIKSIIEPPVWEDLRIVPGAFQFAGVADPTLRPWQPGGAGATFQVYCFSANDVVYFTCQIPHSYKEGSDIRPHIHWTPRDQGVAQNGNTLPWKIDYSWANQGDAFPASATLDLTATCAGVDHEHEYSQGLLVDGTGKTISSMLAIRLYRDVGGTYTNVAADTPALLEFDIHYQKNSGGSEFELTKGLSL